MSEARLMASDFQFGNAATDRNRDYFAVYEEIVSFWINHFVEEQRLLAASPPQGMTANESPSDIQLELEARV